MKFMIVMALFCLINSNVIADDPVEIRTKVKEEDKNNDGKIDRRQIWYYRGDELLLRSAELFNRKDGKLEGRFHFVYHEGKLLFSEVNMGETHMLTYERGSSRGVGIMLDKAGQIESIVLSDEDRKIAGVIKRGDDGILRPMPDIEFQEMMEMVGGMTDHFGGIIDRKIGRGDENRKKTESP